MSGIKKYVTQADLKIYTHKWMMRGYINAWPGRGKALSCWKRMQNFLQFVWNVPLIRRTRIIIYIIVSMKKNQIPRRLQRVVLYWEKLKKILGKSSMKDSRKLLNKIWDFKIESLWFLFNKLRRGYDIQTLYIRLIGGNWMTK